MKCKEFGGSNEANEFLLMEAKYAINIPSFDMETQCTCY
jgi:hypothetical protein